VLGFLCAVLLIALPAWAAGGRVRGKITNYRELVNPVWDDARDPKRRAYSFREIVPTVPSQYRKLFPHIPKEICIAAISDAPQRPSATPVLIRVGGGRTTPVTIVVPPGTRLQFRNTDPFKHRLYGVNIPTFPANDTIKGGAREWTVPAAGAYEIRDELAPSLRTWIVADPKVAAIGYPSLTGDFALRVEQPGTYTLQAFFAGKKVGDGKVVEIKDGADLDVSKEPIAVAPAPKRSDAEGK
jgi:hypothetical protein